MFGTLEAVGLCVSLASIGAGIHQFMSGIRCTRELDKSVEKVSGAVSRIERISDGIVYIPELVAVSPLSTSQIYEVPLTDAYADSLRKLRDEIESDLLVTKINETPTKLRDAMIDRPWDTLLDIRPIDASHRSSEPKMSPVLFRHSGTLYLGWQTKGVLASAFDLGVYPERIPLSETPPDADSYYKHQPTPLSQSELLCPGCREPSSRKNGRYCRTCKAFVHKRCSHREFIDYIVFPFDPRRCPICGNPLV